MYASAISSGVTSYAPSAIDGVGLISTFKPDGARGLRDVVVADHLGNFHRRHIQRMRQRVTRRDLAEIIVLENWPARRAFSSNQKVVGSSIDDGGRRDTLATAR